MSRVRLLATVAIAASLLAAAPASAQYEYSWTGAEASQDERVFRDGIASHYLAPPKAFPGVVAGDAFDPAPFLYTVFDFVNPYAVPAGFFVANVGSTPQYEFGVHLVAYLGSYDPTDLAANYLGDAGVSCHSDACGALPDFSVLAPANATVRLLALRVVGQAEPGGTLTFDAGFLPPRVVTPEPGTWVLLGTGLLAVGAVARRRRLTA